MKKTINQFLMTKKNTLKIACLNIVFLTIVINNLQAQMLEYDPKSPEAANLINNIDAPVTEYTGTYGYSLPVENINEGNLSIPVSVNYRGASKTNDEVASSCGLGWTLNVGGSIARKVNGIPDETPTHGFLQTRIDHPLSEIDEWYENEDYVQIRQNLFDCDDSQPDEFYFDVGGIQGTFAFSWDTEQNIIVNCSSPVRVDHYFIPATGNQCETKSITYPGIQTWVLTTPNGHQYTFSEYELTTMSQNTRLNISCQSFPDGNPNTFFDERHITSWYLTEIKDLRNSNDYINLTYNDNYYRMAPVNVEVVNTGSPLVGNFCLENPSDSNLFGGNDLNYNYYTSCEIGGNTDCTISFTDIRSKSVSSIITSSGYQDLQFIYQTNRNDIESIPGESVAKLLNKIHYSLNNVTVYSYSLGFINNSSAKKVCLNKFQQVVYENNVVTKSNPPYEFTYFNGLSKHQNAVDHWGFPNGSTETSNLPSFTQYTWHQNINLFWSGSDKNANLQGSRSYMLEKIIFPTGGAQEFVYQLNTASKVQAKDISNIDDLGVFEYAAENSSEIIETFSFNDGNPNTTNINSNHSFTIGSDILDLGCNNPGTPGKEVRVEITFLGISYGGIQSVTLSGPNGFSWSSTDDTEIADEHQFGEGYQFSETFCLVEGAYSINLFSIDNLPNVESTANLRVSYTKSNDPTGTIEQVNVGGVRVSEIKMYENKSDEIPENTIFYDYNDPVNGKSNGFIYGIPSYIDKYIIPIIWPELPTPPTFSGFYNQYVNYGNSSGKRSCEQWSIGTSSKVKIGKTKGSHIGYTSVQKSQTSGGYTVSEFTSPLDGLGFKDILDYQRPYAHPISNSHKTGLLKGKYNYDDEGTLITSVENNYQYVSNNVDCVIASFGYYVPPSSNDIVLGSPTREHQEFQVLQNQVFGPVYGTDYFDFTKWFAWKRHPINMGYSNLIETIETNYDENGQNPVSKTTQYYYENPEHLSLTKITTTNSNNKIHETRYKYYDEYTDEDNTTTDANIKTWLQTNNIIEPWETTTYVYDNATDTSPTQTDGTRFEYNNFGTSVYYPKTFKRYEVTWDENGVIENDDGWQNQHVIESYNTNVGKPTSIKVDGWTNPTTYTWTSTGKLNTKTYKDFVTDYNYHPNTDLLSEIIEPDEQKTTFTYDDFMRLDVVESRDGKIKKDYNYSYQPNRIEEITTFSGSTLDKTIFHYVTTTFDGLGRDIEIDKFAHKWNTTNTSIKIVKEYNNRGLLWKVYEPDADETNANDPFIPANIYTEYTYHPDPLGRVKTIKDPMGFTTTSTYGTNSSIINGLAAGTLRRETIEDPDGISSSTYTDKLGRVVATKTFTDTEESITLTNYDDKSRVSTIIPPGATPNDAGLIYQYTYDGADNVLSTKFPDKGLMEYSYDARNLQTAMRDANIKAKGWLNTEYDAYGRLDKQGFGTTIGAVTDLLIQNYYDNNDAINTVNTSTPIYKGKLHKSKVNILNGFNKGNKYLTTSYTLDDYGRVSTESQTSNHISLAESTVYTYNMADNILSNKHTVGTTTSTETFDFDSKGRLQKNDFALTGKGTKTIAEYVNYSVKDELLSKNIGSKTGGYLQTVDYAYNHNGWLSTINGGSVSGTKTNCATINPYASSDLFALDIRYNNAALTGSTNRENGNISEIYWQVKDRAKNGYQFQYDFLNRLTEAKHYVGTAYQGHYDTNYSYDDRGNIMTLSRKGLTGNGTSCTAKQIDNLTYMYETGTNKLGRVFDNLCDGGGLRVNPITNPNYEAGYIISDAKTNTSGGTNNTSDVQFKAGNYISLEGGFSYDINGNNSGFNALIDPCDTNTDLTNHGFKGAESSYQYDGNGNLIKDSQKQLSIAYNHLNLPYKAEKNASNKIEWTYTADGRKLQKKVTENGTVKTKNYLGNMEFTQSATGTNTLEAAYHSEGRVLNSGNTWEYNLKDHLGNVRVVFKENNGNAQIVQENHYYPFGMQLNGNWQKNQSVKNDYLYNAKELNTEIGLNWLHYGARFYDPAVAKFGIVDPMANLYPSIAPHTYVANNPVIFVDPDGQFIETAWDIANVAMGVSSFVSNVKSGNVLGAVVDAVGVVVDAAATVTPLVPGGVGATIKAARGVDKAVDVIQGADKTVDTVKGIDKASEAANDGDDVIGVYRVYGGDSKAEGFSWTTTNPNEVENFRDAAGLPSGGSSGSNNTGRFVVEGQAKKTDVIESRSALPLDGNGGGLPELIIDPQNVEINRVSGVNPEF